MKKKIFLLVLAFALLFPLGVFLTACGGNNNNNDQKIEGVVVREDGETWGMEEKRIYFDYGQSIGDALDKLSFYYRYTNGNQEEIPQDELASFERTETWYIGHWDQEAGEYVYDLYTEPVTRNTVLDAGYYKLKLDIDKYTVNIVVNVSQIYWYEKEVDIAIVPMTQNGYASQNYSHSTFAYGQSANTQYITYDHKSRVRERVGTTSQYKDVTTTSIEYIYAMEKYAGENYDIPADWGENTSAWNANATWADYVQEGDDLLEKYNGISVIDEATGEEDTQKTLELKQHFLSSFGHDIGCSSDDYTRYHNAEDENLGNDFAINTEILYPGEYYLFASYSNNNYSWSYTKPKSTLTVTKGVYNYKKAIITQEWITYPGGGGQSGESHYVDEPGQQEIIDAFYEGLKTDQLEICYEFDGRCFTTTDQKAISMPELASHGYIRVKNGEIVDGLRFVCPDLNLEFLDHANIDYTDNGIILKAVHVLTDEDLLRKYTSDPTQYDVEVVLYKGDITISSGQSGLYYDYTGEPITLDVTVEEGYENLVDITGHEPTQTAIGYYTTRYELKDSVNYRIYENEQTQQVYNWRIQKTTFDIGSFTRTITYGGEDLEINDIVLTYNSKDTTFTFSITSDRWEFIKEKVSDVTLTWSLDGDYQSAVKSFSQDDETAVIEFQLFDGDCAYIDIRCIIPETEYSNAFNSCFGVTIRKIEFTENEQEAILNEIGAEETYDEWGTPTGQYVVTKTLRMNASSMYIPADALPTASTGLGHWALVNNGTEYANGDAVDGYPNVYAWRYKFIPTNPWYYFERQFEIHAEYYLSDAVKSALLGEVNAEYTNNAADHPSVDWANHKIIIEDQEDKAVIRNNTILSHNNEIGISGSWYLTFTVEDGNGDTTDYYYLSNGSELVYGDYNNFSAEFLANNSARNWRLVFYADNGIDTYEIPVTIEVDEAV